MFHHQAFIHDASQAMRAGVIQSFLVDDAHLKPQGFCANFDRFMSDF
jgi:hypothetical protein